MSGLFSDIAAVIREKDSTTARIPANHFPGRIRSAITLEAEPAAKTYSGVAGLKELLKDIADTIRDVDGATLPIVGTDVPAVISRLYAYIPVPTVSGSLTYNGSQKSPTWSGYNTARMTISGTQSATNAGTYTATFALKNKNNSKWADGTTSDKSVNWAIAKAAGSLTLSVSAVTLDSSATTKTVTVTRPGDGAITATSSNTSVATVSVSGSTLTIRSVNNTSGSATITVKAAAGTNYTAPASKTIAVTGTFGDPGLTLYVTAYCDEAGRYPGSCEVTCPDGSKLSKTFNRPGTQMSFDVTQYGYGKYTASAGCQYGSGTGTATFVRGGAASQSIVIDMV